MRIGILTTQTTHHAYFVRELMSTFKVAGCVLEATGVEAPFETWHEYLDQQHEHELSVFFGDTECRIDKLAPSVSVTNINDPAAIQAVQTWNPDLTVAFGVRRLKSETIKNLPANLLNLHAGDPENYRGLDTHLWAIYHSDFDALVTTLHRLALRLDAGDIVQQGRIPLRNSMMLHELRAANTRLCVDLVGGAVDMLHRRGKLVYIAQRQTGRYYSFMPSVLKDIVKRRFEAFTKELP